jgi:putative hydrolase of the HAD superfamily
MNRIAPTDRLDPAAIETWIFDLDNTLYPAGSNLFAQIDQRIGEFIRDYLEVDAVAARKLQKSYFHEQGSTLRGMMLAHDLDPAPYLDYVHDIDLAPTAPSPVLAAVLAALDGQKRIFTNASTGHAQRVMERLGVGHHFEAIFDIAAANYVPKPYVEPYRQLIAEYGIDPESAVFCDDIARNLAPAAALGVTTVWVRGNSAWSPDEPTETEGYVDHVTDDLATWLGGVVADGCQD